MKKLIARIQKDISNLQNAVQKEGNDLLEKIKHIDLKSNLDRNEFVKILTAKLKKMEPTYKTFYTEICKSAKKAGIDLEKFEKNIKAKAKVAQKKFTTKKPTMKTKTSTTKSATKRKTRKTTSKD